MWRACVCWIEADPAAATLAEQLDDVETGRGAQQIADFAWLQARRRFGIERRQPVELAPAEAAALQGVRRIGEGRRQFGEVFARLGPLERLLATQAQLLQLLRTGRLGRPQQDVRQLKLFATAGRSLIGQVEVDLAVGDDELAVHLALAQAHHRHFTADFLAETRVVDAVLFQRLAELLRGHLVVAGNAADGLVELVVVDAQSGIAGKLHLDAIHDDALEQLPLEDILRRQRRALLLQLLERRVETDAQIVEGDDLVTDDGDDAIGLDRLGRRGTSRGREDSDQREDENEEAANVSVHGGHCVVSRLLEVDNSLVLP